MVWTKPEVNMSNMIPTLSILACGKRFFGLRLESTLASWLKLIFLASWPKEWATLA